MFVDMGLGHALTSYLVGAPKSRLEGYGPTIGPARSDTEVTAHEATYQPDPFRRSGGRHGPARPRGHGQRRHPVPVGRRLPELPDEQGVLPWLDPFHYTLAPGGAFESASGLTLTGGAKIVAGNESSYVHGTGDKNSVLIPRGGTVTTGAICVGLDKPTVRFFAKRPSFALLPLLTVEGVYTTKSGATASLPLVGVPLAGNSWSLQLPFVTLGSLELGDTTMMRFRIRAVSGDWQVDDFYVDPMRRSSPHAMAGTCCVMQWTPPPPSARVTPGTGTTSRPGYRPPSSASASSSVSWPATGTISAPLQM